MILLIPEKSFSKKIEKWCTHKDFIIADATEHHDGVISSYGNCIDSMELAGTPNIQKIALDPDSQDSKIKARRIQYYIDMWLSDEGFNLKIFNLMRLLYRNVKESGEDMNIFIVYRNEMFYKYGSIVCDHINSTYPDTATMITHKMPKPMVKEALRREYPQGHWSDIKKALKEQRKVLNVDKKKTLDLYGDLN